jgi:hypothetical protein
VKPTSHEFWPLGLRSWPRRSSTLRSETCPWWTPSSANELTQLASSWAHFVIHACAFLDEDHGRLALVLPAELWHTDYAEPIREYLTKRFGSVVVVAFDRSVFADAEVDAVLMLASNDDDLGMRLLRVHDVLGLSVLDVSPEPGDRIRACCCLHRWQPKTRRWLFSGG